MDGAWRAKKRTPPGAPVREARKAVRATARPTPPLRLPSPEPAEAVELDEWGFPPVKVGPPRPMVATSVAVRAPRAVVVEGERVAPMPAASAPGVAKVVQGVNDGDRATVEAALGGRA